MTYRNEGFGGDGDPAPTGSAAGGRVPLPPTRWSTDRPAATAARPRRAFSRWSIVLFTIVTLLFVAVFIKQQSGGGESAKQLRSIEVGDCLDIGSGGERLSDVDVVPCSQSHQVEVYATGTADDPISAEPSNDQQLIGICGDSPDDDIDAAVAAALADGAELGFLVDGSRTGRVVCTINTAARSGSYLAAARASDT